MSAWRPVYHSDFKQKKSQGNHTRPRETSSPASKFHNKFPDCLLSVQSAGTKNPRCGSSSSARFPGSNTDPSQLARPKFGTTTIIRSETRRRQRCLPGCRLLFVHSYLFKPSPPRVRMKLGADGHSMYVACEKEEKEK